MHCVEGKVICTGISVRYGGVTKHYGPELNNEPDIAGSFAFSCRFLLEVPPSVIV
jgi:hypothetical protein